MHRSRVISTLITLSLAGVLRGANAPIPSRFEFKFDRAVIWVSASEAITSEGKLKPGVVRQEMRKELEFQREHQKEQRKRHGEPSSDCDVAFSGTISESEDTFPVASLDALREVAATRSVIEGVVTATDVGLHEGMPYTILRVETRPPAQRQVVYLLHPTGRLRFDDMTLCNDDRSYGGTPSIGDAVVFVAPPPIDVTETLFAAPGSWMFFEHRGATIAPPEFQMGALSTKQSSVHDIAELLRRPLLQPIAP